MNYQTEINIIDYFKLGDTIQISKIS